MKEWFKCYHPGCQKTYNSKYNLVRHINTKHLLILKYACPHCDRKFPHKQNLGYHLKAHTRMQRNLLTLASFVPPVEPVIQEPPQEEMNYRRLPLILESRQKAQRDQRIPMIPILIPAGFFTEEG